MQAEPLIITILREWNRIFSFGNKKGLKAKAEVNRKTIANWIDEKNRPEKMDSLIVKTVAKFVWEQLQSADENVKETIRKPISKFPGIVKASENEFCEFVERLTRNLSADIDGNLDFLIRDVTAGRFESLIRNDKYRTIPIESEVCIRAKLNLPAWVALLWSSSVVHKDKRSGLAIQKNEWEFMQSWPKYSGIDTIRSDFFNTEEQIVPSSPGKTSIAGPAGLQTLILVATIGEDFSVVAKDCLAKALNCPFPEIKPSNASGAKYISWRVADEIEQKATSTELRRPAYNPEKDTAEMHNEKLLNILKSSFDFVALLSVVSVPKDSRPFTS